MTLLDVYKLRKRIEKIETNMVVLLHQQHKNERAQITIKERLDNLGKSKDRDAQGQGTSTEAQNRDPRGELGQGNNMEGVIGEAKQVKSHKSGEETMRARRESLEKLRLDLSRVATELQGHVRELATARNELMAMLRGRMRT